MTDTVERLQTYADFGKMAAAIKSDLEAARAETVKELATLDRLKADGAKARRAFDETNAKLQDVTQRLAKLKEAYG